MKAGADSSVLATAGDGAVSRSSDMQGRLFESMLILVRPRAASVVTLSANSDSTTISRASASRMISSTSSDDKNVLTGTAMAPTAAQPRKQAINSGESYRIMATRSPASTP